MVPHQRRSLCLVQPEPGTALQHGDGTLDCQSRNLYKGLEGLALDQLVNLKAKLRNSSQHDFFPSLCEEFAQISQSQHCFVMRNVHVDLQHDSATMPPVDEPGSSMVTVHSFYDDESEMCGRGGNDTLNAYNCLYSLMQHGKPVLIPSNMPFFIPHNSNANAVGFACEAYLSIPLFAYDKFIGNFCVMWTPEGLSKKSLSWGFLELLLYSLEDLITQQLIKGLPVLPPATIANGKTTTAQQNSLNLARYAKKISHELRTPLQGIMGLSDLMHATLHDAAITATSSTARSTFQNLKDDIEAVQSSSRRAVDAADNVVQAYELNMLLPDVNRTTISDNQECASESIPRGTKRKCSESNYFDRPVRKIQVVEAKHGFGHFKVPPTVLSAPCEELTPQTGLPKDSNSLEIDTRRSSLYSPPFLQATTPGLQLTDVRGCIRDLVNETIKRDDRLILTRPSYNDRGQVIEVHTMASSKEMRVRTVIWDVEPAVPDYILVEQRDMVKTIACVLHNALKFTDVGRITLQVHHHARKGSISVNIKDTGPGIDPSFRSEIFKPFSQQDDSISRCKEGLGLGLSVAKGLAQRLGGELNLVSADLSGPNRGSEFVLRIPISPSAGTSPTSDSNLHPLVTHQPIENTNHLNGTRNSSDVTGPPRSDINTAPNSIHPSPTTMTGCTASISTPPQLQCSPQTISSPPPYSDPKTEDHERQRPKFHRSASYRRHLSVSAQTSNPEFTRPNVCQSQVETSNESATPDFDHNFAATHPLNFLVAEDNAVNRKLLVKMLAKLGYDSRTQIREACDGLDAVRQVRASAPDLLPGRRCSSAPPHCANASADPESDLDDCDSHFQTMSAPPIDVILMDLWMPNMDGYEATEKILQICKGKMNDHGVHRRHTPVILAVTADATQASLERAAQVGMAGLMLKPFGMNELERIVRDGWMRRKRTEMSLWNGRRWSEALTHDVTRCHATEVSVA